jgi:hypothetical protein
MRAFEIVTGFNYSQKQLVIANTMAEAEKAFLKEYPYTTIKEIKLDATYVIIAEKNKYRKNAFEIVTKSKYDQKHLIIADTIAAAEMAFMKEYPGDTIKEIKLDATYVIIAGENE